MNHREKLEADLATAEAGLAAAVIEQAKLGSDLATTDAVRERARLQVNRARARCLQTRETLAKLIRRGSTDRRSRERSNTLAAGPVLEPRTRGLAPLPDQQASPRQPSSGSARRSSARSIGAKDRPARQVLIRQSVMLGALALAYLQYYFFDVYLQITCLPTNALIGLG